jgi:hypothetical protein
MADGNGKTGDQIQKELSPIAAKLSKVSSCGR